MVSFRKSHDKSSLLKSGVRTPSESLWTSLMPERAGPAAVSNKKEPPSWRLFYFSNC